MVVAVVVVALVGGYAARATIYRQVLIARVADLAAETDMTEEQQALAVLNEISRIAPNPPEVVIDDDPASTLVRGWGFCDALTMSYVQTVERLGLRARLLFLHNEETSWHSVASVWIDGAWRLIDVQYGTVSRTPDGRIATPEDIASGRAETTTTSAVDPSWYVDPQVFYETGAGYTGWKAAARGGLVVGAEFVARWVPGLAQDLYLLTPPRPHVAVNGPVWEDWSGPGDVTYRRARHYDVFGRWEKARAAYERTVASKGEHADEAAFFLNRLP